MKRPYFKQKEQQDGTQRVVSNRILVLALVIVSMFLVMVVRLVDIQAFEHAAYLAKQDDYTSIKQYTTAPRGQIYDCKGRVLAKTVPCHNMVFITPNNVDYEDLLIYADRVGTVFELKKEDFTQSELKDAYLRYASLLETSDPAYNGMDLLTEEEKAQYQAGEMTSSKLRQIQLAAINDEKINSVETRDLIQAAVYERMASNASTGQASVIIEDIGDEDSAYLIEHKLEFPGFDVDFNGWKREYPYGQTLSDVIGSVTTSTEGLPENLAEEYLAKGFQLNAQVGRSGLEYQYNDILSGTSEIAKITYESNGLARKEIIQPAVKGHDIHLSIDIDLQQDVDAVLKDVLTRLGGTENRENFYSLFTCLENPNTGDVLALSGYLMDPETKQLSYYASGNYTSLVNPGSCVKGVTVYMGLSEGVVTPGEVINDEVLNIGGELLGSFTNHGLVDDVSALSVSSNVYMFNIAMRLGGYQYVSGQPLGITDVSGTMNKMRQYYSMFGLGNETGLDVPNEINVYAAGNNTAGMILNYSIGQLDTYTPVQLMQYAGVVATGGKMYQPRFLQYVKEVNGDQIFDINEVKLKQELPSENTEYLNRVQQGFRACVADKNCGDPLYANEHEVSAKTGTAEVNEWTTANLVGYAPASKPTVSFACSAPTSSVNSQALSGNVCTAEVMGPVLDRYFEKYPEEK